MIEIKGDIQHRIMDNENLFLDALETSVIAMREILESEGAMPKEKVSAARIITQAEKQLSKLKKTVYERGF